jgi:Secretion system C-terminal sorting domain
MKRLFTFFALCAALTINAQQIISDNFTYTGELTSNGWLVTDAGGTTAPNVIVTTTPGLTYTGYHASNKGGAATLAVSGQDLRKEFATPVAAGKLYATFMVKPTSASVTGDYFCGFTSGTGSNYNLRFYIRTADTATKKIAFGIGRSSGTPVVYSTTTYDLNATYLVTIVYEYVMGLTNDVASFYVHPTTVTAVEPAATAMTGVYNSATGTDATDINAFFVRQGAAANTVASVIDGIHVGTTWASTFSPATGVAEFKSNDMKVFPTLAKDVLNIEFAKGLGAANVQIVNLSGQVVKTQKLNYTEGVSTINISDLSVGAYIVRVSAGGRELTEKFEKQ